VNDADMGGKRGYRKSRAPARAGVLVMTSADTPVQAGPARSIPDTLREPEPQLKEEQALVLVVDDEQAIAEALSFMIEDAGYATVVASHGLQGLERARALRPALIFTDLMMPHMDGVALIAALRADAAKNGSLPSTPIILMTAAGFDYARTAGADAILPKPFDIKDVERLLGRFLHR
jgi:CheY-like chemotaxis protein